MEGGTAIGQEEMGSRLLGDSWAGRRNPAVTALVIMPEPFLIFIINTNPIPSSARRIFAIGCSPDRRGV